MIKRIDWWLVAFIAFSLSLGTLGVYVATVYPKQVQQEFSIACGTAGGQPVHDGRQWVCLPREHK